MEDTAWVNFDAGHWHRTVNDYELFSEEKDGHFIWSVAYYETITEDKCRTLRGAKLAATRYARRIQWKRT